MTPHRERELHEYAVMSTVVNVACGMVVFTSLTAVAAWKWPQRMFWGPFVATLIGLCVVNGLRWVGRHERRGACRRRGQLHR